MSLRNNPEEKREYNSKYYSIHKGRLNALGNNRQKRLKYKYGLTEDQFFKMLFDQFERCASCREPLRSTRNSHVDHCHETGKVREILCRDCNLAEGYLKNHIRAFRLYKYIKKHASN